MSKSHWLCPHFLTNGAANYSQPRPHSVRAGFSAVLRLDLRWALAREWGGEVTAARDEENRAEKRLPPLSPVINEAENQPGRILYHL